MASENLIDGSTFCLSTGGNPLKVTIGTPENKAKRSSIQQLSLEIIKQLQVVLELSNRKTKEMIATLRKGLGSKLSIEPNIFGRLSELEDYISYYYYVQKCAFVDSIGHVTLRDLVYVQNTSDFVLEFLKLRGLDPTLAFIRISLDGGGSFFKVIINIFDCHKNNDDSDELLNSGVQRSQFLAIVEDIPESNYNLRQIIEKLNLPWVNFYVAFDLKCGNALFGLSGHSGKRACLWCEGISTLDSGKKRTLGSIDYWYNKYLENKSVKSSMKDFMNCINPRILYIDLDPDTLIEQLVSPPELHLLIGFVSLLGNFLLDVWPGFDDWLKSKNVIQRGYQGRGWDGNNSNKILENLDSLEIKMLEPFTCLVPIVQCLKDFRSVKNGCFSSKLQLGFKEPITKLKSSFLSAQEVALNLNKKINTTWKVHILQCHVQTYVEYHNKGLGNFAEQCGESIHAKFKPTWNRFKRQKSIQIMVTGYYQQWWILEQKEFNFDYIYVYI